MKKVVITGIGAVTSIGYTADDYWKGLIEGKCGMRTITRIPLDNHDTTVAAEVGDDFEAEASKYWKKRQLNATTTVTRMGLASAGEAIADCGVDITTCNGKKVGVIYGVIDNSYEDYELDKPLNITLKKMPNELPALVSIKYGFTGPSFNVSTACASSAYALALGKQFIESGLCDMVIAGGISNTVTHLVISGFNQLLAMSVNPDPATAARPFTKNRDGFIMGEGGGTVVLESEESAKARGAKIYCELAGAAMCGEAFNLTAPKTDGVGMAESMRLALDNAGLSPDSIYYLRAYATNSSGTSYGKEFTFRARVHYGQTCPGIPTVTDYDGNVYQTVQIGLQCWMAENLRTTHFADGTFIPMGVVGDESNFTYYRYYPNGDSTIVNVYGYHYNWKTAMHGAGSSNSNPSNQQGVCPSGWHLPSRAEWQEAERA